MSKADQIRALRELAHADPAAAYEALKPKKAEAKPPRYREEMVAKLRALAGPPAIPASYKYRDPDKRRAYMRELMRKRRAEGK